MPAEPEFDHDTGIWVIRLTESVSVEDVIAASRTIDASEAALRNASRLWDARDVEDAPTVDGDDLRSLAAGSDAKEASGHVAVVVRRDIDFGMTRMYSAYVDQWGAEIRVFREYADAVRWLSSGQEPD